MTPPTTTPRTDAQEIDLTTHTATEGFSPNRRKVDKYVPAKLSRQLETELTRLRAEVEQKSNLLVTAIKSAGDQAARAARAEAERDALAADKARLDWLEAHALPQHSPNISISDLGRHYNGFPGSFRDAIDAARKP